MGKTLLVYGKGKSKHLGRFEKEIIVSPAAEKLLKDEILFHAPNFVTKLTEFLMSIDADHCYISRLYGIINLEITWFSKEA